MTFLFSLPLVGLLISIPGIPGLGSKLPKLRLPQKAATDTIPPTWKPASLLAVEDAYVFATLPPLGPKLGVLKVANDPRRLQLGVDPDSGTVSIVPEANEVPIGTGTRWTMAEYDSNLTWRTFQEMWIERSRQSISAGNVAAPTPTGRGSGIELKLPVALPAPLTRVLGPGGPSIKVTGSENIKLSGTSEWSNRQTGLLGQRRSLFPSLDMQQDLDIKLEGQLSDRVKINLLQNSATQIPLANKIAINYRGDEDDLVQSLDLGNTNLSLPGTQYVSYSGYNEGLFGMKASTRAGPLDFTLLASKQEGKSERASYQGGSARQTQTLNDFDYVRGQYFFLYDPNFETQEIDLASIKLYLDDGNIYSNVVNVTRGRAFVDPRPGAARFDSVGTDTLAGEFTPSVRGFFRLLTHGSDADYEVLNNFYGPLYYVIKLRTPVTGDVQRLAVTYNYRPVLGPGQTGPEEAMGGQTITDTDSVRTTVMKLIRAPLSLLREGAGGYFETDPVRSPFIATRELELRNVYQLQGQGIDANSFKLEIRHGVEQPPEYKRVFQIGGQEVSVPYFEILGLDTFDESGGTPIYRQHDGRVDGTLPTSTSRVFVDYKNGTLFFFDLRPFAPRIADNPGYPPRAFDRFLSSILFRRDSLVGEPNTDNERNRDIYDRRNLNSSVRPQVSRYYIDLDFAASRLGREINLGRSNLLQNSEVVSINGRRLEPNRDYTIDYDLGRITLTAQPGPSDQISIDYGYAPLFQQAGRTLVGSAFKLDGVDKNLGGAFLYESKGAQDLRPRLGEEPSRVLIGDLNGLWNMRPAFLTRWIDALPGVRTTSPSSFNVSAEIGSSFPNPNTFNEVFIEDMEGVRDAVTLNMAAERWRWSSMPSRRDPVSGVVDSIQRFQRNAEVHWFNPLNAVKSRDLKPNLTQGQGPLNPHNSLAISVPRRPPGALAGDSLWVGLNYPLDAFGLDLSRSQFIEVWLNDFRNTQKVPRIPGGTVKLHIDIGTVSEDQRRSPGVAANRLLDTEDRPPRDNQLQKTDTRDEDIGIDGRTNADEVSDPSLVTTTGDDPAGDDFNGRVDIDQQSPLNNLQPHRWLRSNGTERNGPGENNGNYPFPDTEDLNLNNSLDLDEDYFEYTIDLAASPYLVDSSYVPGRTFANNGDPVPADNGWRRYRIPITDTLRVRFGNPDLTLARQVRVWLENITVADDAPDPATARPLILLGGIEIVGSRWLTNQLPPAQQASGTTLTLTSINNVDNADIYRPPFDPGTTRNGALNQTRREQSLSLEWTRLLPGDTLEAYKTFSLDENYSRYGTLRWYVAGFDIPGYIRETGNLSYLVRFASDELGRNYYEYRAPVPPSSAPGNITWGEVALQLTELSNLKIQFPNRDSINVERPDGYAGERLIVKGRPSFTRLRRISFGVLNHDSLRVYESGSVWLDEIRATDVARDRGQAQRVSVAGRMANLLDYNVGYNARDEDFLSVGETRGSGSRTNNYNANANFDLHRFFEGTGIILPISMTASGSRAQPRYTAGDDVFRTGAQAEASESRSNARGYQIRYSRSWSERSNPLLRYTLGGITASLGQNRTEQRNPASVDTTRTLNAGVSYVIAPRAMLQVPIPGTKSKLYPLPERFYWNYTLATGAGRTYDRLRDSLGTLVLRNATNSRSAFIDFGATTRLMDQITHQFQGRRNLTLPEHLREQIGLINLGRVVLWNQTMDMSMPVNRGPWLKPQLGWNASFNQNNGPELSPSLSIRTLANAQSYRLNWILPFDQLAVKKPPAPGARRDSVTRGPAPWRGWLSRLGAVSMDASFNQTSSYTRLSGSPKFAYLVGLANDPGLGRGVEPQFGNSATLVENWRTGLRTRLLLFFGSSVQTQADFSRSRNTYNNVVGRSHRSTFPNLDVDFGRIPDVIGLKKVFLNPRLRSAYSRSVTVDYVNSPRPTGKSSVSEFRPLLGLSGDLKNGTRAELRVQHRASETEYTQVGRTITTDANTDIDMSLSRSYTKGQKVNILGRESTVKTSVNLGMTAAYSRRNSETRQENVAEPFNPVLEDRLSVSGRGSYGFSNNVTGNVELGFSQNRDLQRDIVTRSIRIELRAQFGF